VPLGAQLTERESGAKSHDGRAGDEPATAPHLLPRGLRFMRPLLLVFARARYWGERMGHGRPVLLRRRGRRHAVVRKRRRQVGVGHPRIGGSYARRIMRRRPIRKAALSGADVEPRRQRRIFTAVANITNARLVRNHHGRNNELVPGRGQIAVLGFGHGRIRNDAVLIPEVERRVGRDDVGRLVDHDCGHVKLR